MSVIGEIVIEDVLHPPYLFGYLLMTTLISGGMASLIVEKIGVKIFT